MRILFICNYSLLYGANRSLLTIIANLKNKGYEILVFLPMDGPIATELEKLQVNYKIMRFFPSYLYFKLMMKHLLVPFLFFYNILIFPLLFKTTKIFRPDLIYSNTSAENIGIILSKILKIKHISHIREFMSLDHGSYFVLGRGLKSKFINLSDGAIFVSNVVRDYVMSPADINFNKHIVIYNGISNNICKHKKEFTSELIRFGSIGVLQPSKGHHLAIEYFSNYVKINDNVELHIWGDGYESYKKKLLTLIKEYNLENKVFLHGFVKNIDEIYSKIDALCVFSRSEGFGRVTVEAMFYGIPVLGLNKGATKELIIHNKTGFLFDNYSSFKIFTNKLFLNQSVYANISKNCQKIALEKFSSNEYAVNIEKFIIKTIQTNK